MDKFGVFKLLNSFFNFYEQNKGNFANNPTQDKSAEQNPLSDVLSMISNKNQHNKNNQPQAKKPEKTYAPLQSSMLSTMNSHDEFIKRVKEKNGALQK